jgi:hypothetical protein
MACCSQNLGLGLMWNSVAWFSRSLPTATHTSSIQVMVLDSGPQATGINADHDVFEKKGEMCSVRMQEKKEERRIYISPSQCWLQHIRQAYIVLEK